MIKYIAAIILLCILSQASAQNDSLMPNLSADYFLLSVTESPWSFGEHILFSNPNPAYDTVDVYTENDELFAKLFMDTLKVWVKGIGNETSWSEVLTNDWELLYDFGLEVGDTAYSIYFDAGIITSRVEIEVQGQTRKKFILNGGTNAYIQGVGDVHHPFLPKLYTFENGYETCTSHLYYSGPSPIDSITFSPDCNGEILSTRQVELADFNVFPNPASETLNISLNDGKAESGTIYDSLGKRVKFFSVKSQEIQVDVHELNPGIYFVKIQLENGQILVRKFVKGR